MQLSIIIVNYNVSHYLNLCLDSVYAAILAMKAEVIVVDNASTDESLVMIKEKFPEVIILANSHNVGFSAANNQGVAIAQGEYICILNPDTVVAEDTFKEVHAFVNAQQNPGAIGVRLIDGRGRFLPESKRNVPTTKVSLNKIIGDGSAYYANHLKATETGAVAVLVGAFMYMKRVVYEKVGGFDESYFMYGEDIDLSYTITQAGYTNYYLGRESIIHFKGESTIKDAKYRKRFYGAMDLFYQKHLRKNALENFFVKMGLAGARLKAGRVHHKKKEVARHTSERVQAYLVVTNKEELCQTCKKWVTEQVRCVDKVMEIKEGEELLFDASFLPYKEIIKEIITTRGVGVTYKIIPKNCTFAVGSNSSEGKGVILSFDRKE